WSRYWRRVSLINLWKVAGAPVSPNGITKDSNRPKRVRKAVRYSCPSFIRILLKADTISILEKYFIPCRLFRVSLISGNGYRSFTEMLLRDRKSIQSRNPPPGFFTNKTGEATGEELGRINPFFRFSSNHSRRALSSSRDIEYKGPKGRTPEGRSGRYLGVVFSGKSLSICCFWGLFGVLQCFWQ
ncbi:hypothetical protein M433DRAFT_301030, partial [Acidomyces richmondensis BFW]